MSHLIFAVALGPVVYFLMVITTKSTVAVLFSDVYAFYNTDNNDNNNINDNNNGDKMFFNCTRIH